MLESVSTDSRHYPHERGARFAERGGRFTPIRYRTLKLRALRWVLRLRRGRQRVMKESLERLTLANTARAYIELYEKLIAESR